MITATSLADGIRVGAFTGGSPSASSSVGTTLINVNKRVISVITK